MHLSVKSDYDFLNHFVYDKFLRTDAYFSFRFGIVLIELFNYRNSFFTVRTVNWQLSNSDWFAYRSNFDRGLHKDSLYNRFMYNRFSSGRIYYGKFKKIEFLDAIRFYRYVVTKFCDSLKVDDDYLRIVGDCDYNQLFMTMDKMLVNRIKTAPCGVDMVKPHDIDLKPSKAH